MTMKSLLSTASLAILLAAQRRRPRPRSRWAISPTIRVRTSDVGTPFGQGVADTYAWINKNGGIGGKQAQCRHRRLRLSGAARHRAVQEMVRRRQGRRHSRLGHRRHRSADRIPGAGQDPGYLGILCRSALRSDRRRRQGQARALQFLLWPELFGRGSRHADLGRRGLEGQGQTRQAEIRPHGRQPSLSERAEGGGRSDCRRTRLRGAAADRVRVDARRLQRAVPDPEELRRQLRLSRQHRRPPTSPC